MWEESNSSIIKQMDKRNVSSLEKLTCITKGKRKDFAHTVSGLLTWISWKMNVQTLLEVEDGNKYLYHTLSFIFVGSHITANVESVSVILYC